VLVPLAAIAAGLLLGALLVAASGRVGAVAVAVLVVALLAAPGLSRRPDLVLVGLALSLGVGPLVLGPVEVVQVTTLLSVAAVLVPAALRMQVRVPPWPVAAPMAAFVVLAVVSSAVAPVPALAFNLLVQLVSLVLLTLATTTALRTPEQVGRAVVALVVAGGALAAYAVLTAGPTETYYGGGVVTGRATGLFSQPNELGLVSAALLVVAVGVGLTATRPGLRWLCGGCGLLLLAALGLSLSRGAWLGAVAGLVVLACVCRPTRRPLALLAATSVVGLLGLAALGVGLAAEVVGRVVSIGGDEANPYDQRGLIWSTALRLIAERPWTGHGPGGYTAPAASEALREGAFLGVEHAHDLVLTVGVEHGLLGVVALLALVVGVLACAVAGHRSAVPSRTGANRRGTAALPGILTAALVAVVVHTVVDYPLRNATCITVVWLLVSVVAALTRTTEGPPPPTRTDR